MFTGTMDHLRTSDFLSLENMIQESILSLARTSCILVIRVRTYHPKRNLAERRRYSIPLIGEEISISGEEISISSTCGSGIFSKLGSSSTPNINFSELTG